MCLGCLCTYLLLRAPSQNQGQASGPIPCDKETGERGRWGEGEGGSKSHAPPQIICFCFSLGEGHVGFSERGWRRGVGPED